MKICPNCAYHNREGYMFCEDCGEDLTPVESSPALGQFVIPRPEEPAILLQVQGSSTVLGRVDRERGYHPDVDPTMYKALEQGISGLHAAVEHTEEGLRIVDLGSTNGTYVNGRRVLAEQAHMLRDGDEVRLGHLVTTVRLTGIAG
jgi:pSer/pThr/pTyr-binding forkhead associated (FHA) protein